VRALRCGTTGLYLQCDGRQYHGSDAICGVPNSNRPSQLTTCLLVPVPYSNSSLKRRTRRLRAARVTHRLVGRCSLRIFCAPSLANAPWRRSGLKILPPYAQAHNIISKRLQHRALLITTPLPGIKHGLNDGAAGHAYAWFAFFVSTMPPGLPYLHRDVPRLGHDDTCLYCGVKTCVTNVYNLMMLSLSGDGRGAGWRTPPRTFPPSLLLAVNTSLAT